MKWKLTAFALWVALTVVAVLYFLERRRPPATPAAEALPPGWKATYVPGQPWGYPIEAPAARALPDVLAKPIAELNVEKTPLEEVLKILAQKTQTEIVGDWELLAQAGLDRRTPMTLRLTGQTLESILCVIEANLQQLKVEAGHFVQGSTVYLSTRERSEPAMVTRVYDVRELIRDAAELDSAETALRRPRGAPAPVMGGPVFGSNYGDLGEELRVLLQEAIDAQSWVSNGGKASIRYWAGRLIVTQTQENHRKIQEMLYSLRPGAPDRPTIKK